MADRCTGHCCRAFTLDMSPDEVWRALLGSLVGAGSWFDDDGRLHGWKTDIETI